MLEFSYLCQPSGHQPFVFLCPVVSVKIFLLKSQELILQLHSALLSDSLIKPEHLCSNEPETRQHSGFISLFSSCFDLSNWSRMPESHHPPDTSLKRLLLFFCGLNPPSANSLSCPFMEWLLSMPAMPANTFFLAERERRREKKKQSG